MAGWLGVMAGPLVAVCMAGWLVMMAGPLVAVVVWAGGEPVTGRGCWCGSIWHEVPGVSDFQGGQPAADPTLVHY
jgi:hypothetical protein